MQSFYEAALRIATVRLFLSLCIRLFINWLLLWLLGEIDFCSASDCAYSYAFLRNVVCRSVACRLSHSCTLLKPFNGFSHSFTVVQSSHTLC